MWKLSKYLKPYWKVAMLAPLLILVEVFMDLLQPKLISNIVNHGVLAQDIDYVIRTGLLMVGVSIVGLLGGVGCTIAASISSQSFGADLREDLFKIVQAFSFKNLDELKTGSLITRLTNDVVQVKNVVQAMLRVLIRAPFLAIGSFVMALTLSPKLALIFVVIIPLLVIVVGFVVKKGFPIFSQVQKKLDGVNNVMQENLSGMRVVKAFVRADYEKKRFRTANDDLMDIAIKGNRVVGLIMPLMMLIMNASIVAVIWFGGLQNWNGDINLGDLIAFINYVTQVLFSLMLVGMMLIFVSRAKASADRINEVLETKSEIVEPEAPWVGELKVGKVVFDNVSFAYDQLGEELVLKDINLTAKPGETLAILGSTGAGKSTLVNLIPRLYDTTKGRIFIDGVDIRDISLRDLRSNIGIVLQEAILFTGTIKENISFGKPDATDEEIEAAAKAAQAHDFIMKTPDRYDTQLGQRGINLSGGQKQRISIARALLINPLILIFDDSTSAVDIGTESRIQKALKEQMRKSTSLIIAQRISSVLEADKIVVLDEGRIVAEGTHKELMKNSSVYQDIYRSQLGEGEVVNG